MQIEHGILIDAPASRVWALTEDVEAWPALTPTVTHVTRLDDTALAPGSRVRIEQPGQPARVWTVTALEPERRFAWRTRAFGVRMTATHELLPSDGGTRNLLTIRLEGRLSGLVGFLLGPPIRKALAAENAGFKAAAEAEGDSRA